MPLLDKFKSRLFPPSNRQLSSLMYGLNQLTSPSNHPIHPQRSALRVSTTLRSLARQPLLTHPSSLVHPSLVLSKRQNTHQRALTMMPVQVMPTKPLPSIIEGFVLSLMTQSTLTLTLYHITCDLASAKDISSKIKTNTLEQPLYVGLSTYECFQKTVFNFWHNKRNAKITLTLPPLTPDSIKRIFHELSIDDKIQFLNIKTETELRDFLFHWMTTPHGHFKGRVINFRQLDTLNLGLDCRYKSLTKEEKQERLDSETVLYR